MSEIQEQSDERGGKERKVLDLDGRLERAEWIHRRMPKDGHGVFFGFRDTALCS
jgi:hypothetical protein